MNFSLFIIIILSLFGASQAGKVHAVGRTPILLSSNNVDEISSYTFTFYVDTPTQDGDLLVIKFPMSQFGHFSVLDGTTCSAYLHPELFITTQTTLSCKYDDEQFLISLVELNNGDVNHHSVTILGLKNPSTVGGTGNFQIEVRRGLANILDFNGAFNQVGFVAAPTPFTSVAASISGDTMINQNGTYTFGITTLKVIPQAGSIVITFPSATKIYTDFTCPITPLGSTCARLDERTIKVSGFSADIPAGLVSVSITKVLNADYAGSVGNIKVQSWTNSVNTILEQSTQAMPTPVAGSISGSPSTYYTNFQQSGLTLVPSDYTSYEVSFKTINPIPTTGAVQLTFPSTMAPALCVPYLGFNDISESSIPACAISGNTIKITNFKPITANQLLTVQIRTTNPSTTGATSTLAIQTFKDAAATQLIDQLPATPGFTFTISSTITKMQVLSLAADSYVAGAAAVWTITWRSVVALNTANPGIFQITMPTGFTYAIPTCRIKSGAGSYTAITCTPSGSVLTFASTGTTTYSDTLDNALEISGITNGPAGDYPVLLKLQENAIAKRSQTLLLTITASPTITVSVNPLTLDRARFTLFEVVFTAPVALSAGIHPETADAAQTVIRLEFQTASGATALFATNLGRSDITTSGSTIPCYGADALKPYTTGGKLRCKIFFATTASATDPAIIEVYDFASIASGDTVTLQLPKIQNPDSRTMSASVDFSLKKSQYHTTRTLYTKSLTLTQCVLDAVVGSPNNNNGVNGIPTNLAPTFNPNAINKVSRAEVKLTPGSGRNLPVGSKLILDFPLLPTSTPPYYVFDSTTRCELGLGTTQSCLVFPEVGWIVIKNLVTAFTPGTEYSITLFNVKNPPFAAALQGALRVVTIQATRETEEFKYTSFASFKAGSLSNINVFPSRFEANQVDVEYNWIFLISNPIPLGSSIELMFPPNLYNLESNPPVTGKAVTGLVAASAASPITFSFAINVATIKGFAAVSAGTLIRITINGVKNPIQATRTTNFAITTKDPKSYSIDVESLISGLNILKANPVGVIVFNHFYTTPSNGKMRGNYYLSFYPQTDYPEGTTIQVIFPSTEFDPVSFPTDVTCSISGALTTFDSCTSVPASWRYDIITDKRLEIEPGMQPINIFFPHIMNFNEELSSGVIVVRAIYDGVVLDESGNAEDGRKAATGLKSSTLLFSGFSFVPTTEGQSATYTVTLKPALSFSLSTVIQFEFPNAYTAGLGERIDCQIPALQISTDRPIKCTVSDRIVNITNHKGFDVTTLPGGFTVTISGVVNPNSYPTVTGKIAVYILTTETFAQENTDSLGTLTFTAAPKVLDMDAFSSTNTQTRKPADYSFTMTPSINVAASSELTTEFSSEYDIQTFSKNPTLTFNTDSPVTVTPTGNTIIQNLAPAMIAGTSFNLKLTNMANPLDEGEKRYPTVFIQKGAVVQVRTYDNLIKPLNLNFAHGGEIITINDDKATLIHPGQANKYKFKFIAPTTQALTIRASPIGPSYIKVSDITIPVGATEAEIWIGVVSDAKEEDIYIEWTIVGDTANHFWVIRPFEINIRFGQTEIFVDEIVHVPAGGRTSPLYVTLSNSPLEELTVLLYQRGTIPTYVTVYPSKIIFKQGELKKPFWVSSGKETKGVVGSVIFLINGTNEDAYFMTKRLRSFIVSRGDVSAPYLFSHSHLDTQDTYITVSAKTSEPCTIFFFIAPNNTLIPPMFEDIKAKKIRYDYYGGEYVAGEAVSDTANYDYKFNATGLRPGMDYTAYFYIEDFSGNVGEDTWSYYFTTKPDYPQQVWMNILISPLADADITALFEAIATVTDITTARLETDLTVLSPKSGGDTSGDFDTTGVPNLRTLHTSTGYSAPSVSTGSQLTFIIFPDVASAFGPSCSAAVEQLKNSLDKLNTIYSGGNKIGVAYGVKNNAVEPDDIKWSSASADATPSSDSIAITGVSLNAAGTIHVVAYAEPRTVFYSSQDSYAPGMRYLKEASYRYLEGGERQLDLIYGQQTCVNDEYNELTVSCSGADLPAQDNSREDYAFNNTPPLPSSYFVSRESDGNGFKGDAVASIVVTAGDTANITLSGLQPGTKYQIYLSATDGYAKYPERMMDKYVISLTATTLAPANATAEASVLSVGSSIMATVFTAMLML